MTFYFLRLIIMTEREIYIKPQFLDSNEYINEVIKLINDGSLKFKYGLLWYLIHHRLKNTKDYHYIDLLKLSKKQIHDILKQQIELSHYKPDEYKLLYKLQKFIMKETHFVSYTHDCSITKLNLNCPFYICDMFLYNDEIISKETELFDEVNYLSEVLYYLLTSDDYKKSYIMNLVFVCADRVICNYTDSQTGLFKKPKTYTSSYDCLKAYRLSKGLSFNF